MESKSKVTPIETKDTKKLNDTRALQLRRYRIDVLIRTLKYFGRLVSYVGTIYVLLQAFVSEKHDSVHKTVEATRQVILLAILMLILCVLMMSRPQWYEKVRWYCTPGNIFLRSWTPLFAVSYLIQLPYNLEGVKAVNILSWLAQIGIGYVLTIASCGWFLTGVFKFIKMMTNLKTTDPKKLENDVEIDVTEDVVMPSSSQQDDDINNNYNNNNMVIDDDESIISDREEIDLRPRLMSVNDELPINLVYSYKTPSSLTISESARIASEKKFDKSEINNRLSSSRSSSVSSNVSPMLSYGFQPTSSKTTTTTTSMTGMDVNFKGRTISNGEGYNEDFRIGAEASSKKYIQNLPLVAPSSKSPIQTFLSAHQMATLPDPMPLIPTMRELFYFWLFVFLLIPTIAMFLPQKTREIVVAFQIAASVLVFLFWQQFRTPLVSTFPKVIQILLQEPLLFMTVLIPIVLCSYSGGFSDMDAGFAQYRVGTTFRSGASGWGAGDYCCTLLNAAIVSNAFPAADSVMAFKKLMPVLVPATFLLCLVVLVETAAIASAFNTPMMVAFPLLTRCIAAPIAINIAASTGACPGIVVATIVINTVLARVSMPSLLDFLRIKNPLARGPTASTCGLLLGIIALDENKEILAAGVGTAVFGLSTIFYTILLSIPSFLKVLEIIS